MVGESFLIVVPDEAKEELASRHDDFFSYQHKFSGQWNVMRQDGTQRQVLRAASGDAARKSIRTGVSYQGVEQKDSEEASVNFRADQFYVEQMLTNLVVNALEASSREEELTITITLPDRAC